MTVFFTSDNHFSHANIIPYCGRPFRDAQEMDDEMVRLWNERVTPDDTVVHLGDFAFGPVENIGRVRARLNGIVWLIRGNHDRSAARMLEMGFDVVLNELNWDPRIALGCTDSGAPFRVFMRHRPPRTEVWREHADVFLCGHVHNHWARRGNVINVGVDVSGFRPLTLDELLFRP